MNSGEELAAFVFFGVNPRKRSLLQDAFKQVAGFPLAFSLEKPSFWRSGAATAFPEPSGKLCRGFEGRAKFPIPDRWKVCFPVMDQLKKRFGESFSRPQGSIGPVGRIPDLRPVSWTGT